MKNTTHDKRFEKTREFMGDRIARRRVHLNLSQKELAKETRLGIATIKRMESGKHWPNMQQFFIVIHHLGITYSSFF